jgi:hypothetical protein
MSTRSTIGIRRKDGSVSKIYCHWDGYVEYNGALLQAYYNTADKVEELLKLGALSSLGKKITPTTDGHNFDHPEEDVCVAYHRDRGEDLIMAEDNQVEEFNYMFNCWEGLWYVTDTEYLEENKSPAIELLGLGAHWIDRTRLLLDAILECEDQYLKVDKKTCIEKAKEGRESSEETNFFTKAPLF